MGKNVFMAEVSHTLSELQKEGKILYYYKFPETKAQSLVIADHFAVLPSKQVIFLEEKSSKKGKIGAENIFGKNKEHQVYYNKILFPHHIYLFRFTNGKSIYYTYADIISNLPARQQHKSYISIRDFNTTYEGKQSLKSMLSSLLLNL